MDYSLIQRIIDGTGMIFDTTPGSPDKGSYVTEQQLADWIKGQAVVPAYYYNGVMYSDAGHTSPITGQTGILYIDQDNNVLYRWDGASWEAMSDSQLRQDILDGTVIAKKAECDQYGNVIDTTYETKADASNLNSAIQSNTARIENLEQHTGDVKTVSYPNDPVYTTSMPNLVPPSMAKNAKVVSIVGKVRAWNGLINEGSSATINGVTYTVDNTNHTITAVANSAISSNSNYLFYQDSLANGFKGIVGHKYLVYGQKYPEGYFTFINNGGFDMGYNSFDNDGGRIITCTDNTKGSGFMLRVLSGNTINRTLPYPILRDLTLIFPEGVPSTVAECVAICPDILKYDAYGYSLVSTTVEGVVSKRTNLVTQTSVEVSSASALSNEFSVNDGQSIFISGQVTRITGATITNTTLYLCRVSWYNGSTLISTVNGDLMTLASGSDDFGFAMTAPSGTTKAVVDWGNYNGDSNINTEKSRMSRRGCFRMARAIAIRWRSPPDNVIPFSPT